jgi:hypothetical protein
MDNIGIIGMGHLKMLTFEESTNHAEVEKQEANKELAEELNGLVLTSVPKQRFKRNDERYYERYYVRTK